MKNNTSTIDLFNKDALEKKEELSENNTSEKLQRLDLSGELRKKILPFCRLKKGEIWYDAVSGHRVGVLDATNSKDVESITQVDKATLMVNDPPYNVVVGNANTKSLSKITLGDYMDFSQKWIENSVNNTQKESHHYIWIGADYKDHFQPLPDLMLLLRKFEELVPRNLITMRNQRGYGTLKNWMWVRQELLYYVKGNPSFNVDAVYTDIPKILKGYYKKVKGKITENLERSRSKNIRAGNVWVDIQQVFYRMEENVPGCYAQKPLKSIERIVDSSSQKGDLVMDFFSHSGTTLIAGEILERKVYTFDMDPIYAELTIRRLENFRRNGKTGWQWKNPFPEIEDKFENKRWI